MARVAATVAVVILIITPAVAQPAAPIPSRPDAIDERLPNGLRLVILPHDGGGRRVAVRLLINAGTIHERDDERGVAHLIQHLAFQGSDRFPRGSAREIFRSLGMEVGRHESAYVTFDHTAYTLELPTPAESAMRRGFTFLADVLGGLTFPEGAVETEHRVIEQEFAESRSVERRLFDEILPGLLPGSRAGSRIPSSPIDAGALTREHCVAYHRAWYTPSNATLIVAGPVVADEARRLARSIFEPIPSRPAPRAPDPGVRETERAAAVIVADEELATGVVGFIHAAPRGEPTTNTARFRDGLVDQLIRRLISRRLDARAFRGESAYSASGAAIGEVFGAARLAQIVATGEPARWREMLDDLTLDVERARRFGFLESEVALARDAAIAEARAIARVEQTLPASQLVAMLTEQILAREPLVSAAQNLALVERFIGAIDAEEASRRFASLFAPDRVVTLVELVSRDDAPTPGDALARVAAAAALPVEAPEQPRTLDRLAERASSGFEPVDVALDSASGVLTLTLPSGVVAHHKRLESRGRRLVLRATISGGEIEETAATRGLTSAAAAALSRPSAPGRDGLAVRDALSSKGIEISAFASLDAVTIRIEAPADEAETAFALLRLTLTEPTVERGGLEAWRVRIARAASRRATSANAALEVALADALTVAAESRIRPISADRAGAIKPEDVQSWLDRLVRGNPIEVAVVGAIGRADAARLAAEHLGDLTPRPAPDTSAFASQRRTDRADAPFAHAATISGPEGATLVALGFIGPDAADENAVRALELAQRIMRQNLLGRLRDRLGIASDVRVIHRPAQALPGMGVFLITATTTREHTDKVADVLGRALREFASDGPGQYDVAVAQASLAGDIAASADDPQRWAAALAEWRYRGRSLDALVEPERWYAGISPADIRREFEARLRPEGMIRIVIQPAP